MARRREVIGEMSLDLKIAFQSGDPACYIPRGYFLQAIVKEQLGQSAQAEEAIRRYMARFPNDLAAYKVLARLEFAQHRPDLAADTLVKIVESGSADAETYDLLGRAYVATGRGAEILLRRNRRPRNCRKNSELPSTI